MSEEKVSKRVTIGSVFLVKDETGGERYCIGLGNGSKDERYKNTVEVIVRDVSGRVIARKTEGFIGLVDPRVEVEELLSKGKISEEQADLKREQLKKLSSKLRFQLTLPRSG